ncbi:MAG: D-2-hydroxyacid dehydrogenase [Planctomycetota bacterium]
MKIVVLDGYTLNPGDLSWDDLKSLGDCTIYDRTPARLTVKRAQEAEVVLTNKTLLDRPVLEELNVLRYIGVLATGYNVVDIDAATEEGVVVTNVPAYSTESVAQMTFAHILNLTQQVGHHNDTVREGRWTECDDFCYWDTPLVELQNRTLGIIGLGRIGRAVARIAHGFGMRILAYNPSEPQNLTVNVEMVDDIDELLPQVDVLTLHCPLTDENEGMIDGERLSRMKSTAFFINTARGPLVVEEALARALEKGTIAGAGLDVLSCEPPSADNPLLDVDKCYITPHIAWATREARGRLMKTATANVAAFLRGDAQNKINDV